MKIYEYKMILQKAGLRNVALANMKKVITKAYKYSRNPSKLLKTRNKLAKSIFRLAGSDF